jgi:serine phosphatase RsbU (regulator of sigma subunit)
MTPWPPCRADGLPAPLLIPADRTSRTLGAWLALNLLVLVAYSVLGVVIVLFGIGPAKISPIYPPSGIAFAATAILGSRVLPAVFVGQFLNGFPLLMEPGTTLPMYMLANGGTGIGGVLEALLAAVALWRVAGTPHPFERPRQVVIFLVVVSLGAAVVGGTVGTFSMWACGFVPKRELVETLATFIFSDASGIAVFGALVLAWHREPMADAKLVGVSLGAIAGIVLVGLISAWTRHPIFFLYLPLLLWAAFGGGPRGVTVAATAITAVALVTTSYGVGSFVGRTPEESVLLLIIFISVMTFTGLVTVAVLAQRRQAELALEAYNRMLEQRVAERTAEVAEKNRLLEEKQARIDEDLHTARVLQASILPTDFSAYRDTDIAAAMRPALEMSGDFYDVFPLDGGRLGLVVADVSGKGVASAFFMAVTRTMLRNDAQGGAQPPDCIARVNEALCRENPVEMFVTALYGELEQASGLVRIVNAGHCEPIVVRADGTAELLRRSGNPPLGVMSGRKFAEASVTLGAGDTLFLYTDGVTEAANRDGEMFRVPRLLEAVRPLAGRPAKELMLSVIAGVESFSAGALQADDITCLAVRRNRV